MLSLREALGLNLASRKSNQSTEKMLKNDIVSLDVSEGL